ncbi:MAG TPA: hypothetical protein PKY88_12575 [Anaerohalosphaeraceae bacterium]|nr:hypothetical protein [Anaerohalosphaeraceae bacterium]
METPLNLQTCDILLCSGSSRLSRRIKTYNHLVGATGTAASISHVALAASGGSAVFEATTLNRWAGKSGVQINPFDNWLSHYPGSVWVRRLHFLRPPEFENKASDVMQGLIGLPYEHGIPGAFELLLCGIKWTWFCRLIDRDRRLQTVELHCTEAAARVLQRLGLMHQIDRKGQFVYPNKLPPFQWWPGGRVETLFRSFIRIEEPVRIQ